MLRAKSRRPAHGLHKASGQAAVYLDRRPIDLDVYDSAKSWQKYYRLLAENPSTEARRVVVKQGDALSVTVLVQLQVGGLCQSGRFRSRQHSTERAKVYDVAGFDMGKGHGLLSVA